MQVSETLSEGLKRELKVTVPAAELSQRLSARLEELKDRVRLKGFRPGKVPMSHLKRMYGRSAMAEIVETVVGETSRSTLTERGERPAVNPEIAMTEDEAEANRILAGDADLTFTMSYEVLPEFQLGTYSGLAIERPVVEVGEDEVGERVGRIAESNRTYEAVERAAEGGDQVTLSYLGKLDGEPFPGGADEDAKIVVGSGRFVPGFEDGVKGLSAGEEKTIEITMPEAYPAKNLAGKTVTFDLRVKEIAAPKDASIDDEFAKRLGIESIDRLKATVRSQIESEYGTVTRQRVKRQLLDRLDESHKFDLPARLVDQEFDNIWRQVTHDIEQHGRSFADEGTTEEKAREDYRRIAERRVRLGLVLARIGEEAKVEVTDEEVQRALYAQMQRYPGQENQVLDFYRKNPMALQALRAPIFEEKVVDHILGLADVTDKTVTKDELIAEEDLEDLLGEPHFHADDEDDQDHGHHDHEGHDHHGHDHEHHDHDHGGEEGAKG